VDPARFCSQSRLVIVAGKGGVGKTTVTAALSVMAADAGLRTLIVEVEGKTGLGTAFGRGELSYDETEVAERVRARTITSDQALLEYLEDHGMRRLSKRLSNTGFLDVVATAAPGIKDILVLGKVKSLEKSRDADLIVLDAPAAGHAVTFLTSARGLLDAVRVGPVRTQAEEVLEMLTDPARCQVLLVTLPEETPVNEAVETAARLRERVGIHLGGIVVNGLYPPVAGLESAPELLDGDGVPADEAGPPGGGHVPAGSPGPATGAAAAAGREPRPAPTASAVPLQSRAGTGRDRRAGGRSRQGRGGVGDGIMKLTAS
jgi:anion-transporting  ArsA/GET3 family ATPase